MQSVDIQEKQIQINNLSINYKTIGNGKIPIVLLHGWGVSSDKYAELIKTLYPILNTQYSILILDLPGFGKSNEPNKNWRLDDYVEFVDEFIKKTNRKGGFELVKNILEKKLEQYKQCGNVYCHTEKETTKDVILIGHSFGGKIAIKYATKYPERINKLILTGAAGIKHKLTTKQKIFFILAKTGKTVFSLPIINNFQKPIHKIFSKLARSRKKDYYSASSRMKEIMKNILAEEITDHLDKIKNPTLLVWGREDRTTPLSDGKIMNERIEDSKLIIVDNANHSLPYQKPKEFAKIIEEFIKK